MHGSNGRFIRASAPMPPTWRPVRRSASRWGAIRAAFAPIERASIRRSSSSGPAIITSSGRAPASSRSTTSVLYTCSGGTPSASATATAEWISAS